MMADQREYCKLCNESFENFEALVMHKWSKSDHVFCIFCYRDFNSIEGRKRHQDQDHAAVQDLKCAGCDEVFKRAGTYIAHIEGHMCPVIHADEFESRRVDKKNYHRHTRPSMRGSRAPSSIALEAAACQSSWDQASGVTGKPITTIDDAYSQLSIDPGEDLLHFDENPVRPAWGSLEEIDEHPRIDTSVDNFPPLATQSYQAGGTKVPDLLAGKPDPLNQRNKEWVDLFPYSPRPISPEKPVVVGITINDAGDEEYHKFDPDNPEFDYQKLWNPIVEKFRCCWPRCKSKFATRSQLYQHLRSPSHMDERLRCPSCLRQYNSATALVQHTESQARKCQIRDSRDYRQAVDLITGGLLDTAGRHDDLTVKYITPALPSASNSTIPRSDNGKQNKPRTASASILPSPPPPSPPRASFPASAFPPLPNGMTSSSKASSFGKRPDGLSPPITDPSANVGPSAHPPTDGIGSGPKPTGILGGKDGLKKASDRFWADQMAKQREQIEKQNRNTKW